MTDDEPISGIEPTWLENPGDTIADLVADIIAASTRLGTTLPATTATSLADLVRVMNCYYSNLIEGHNARPRDIERALASDFEADEKRRDLQLEARAHMRLQAEIDARHSQGTLDEPAAPEFIQWLHREFYRDAPESMLRVGNPPNDFLMTPGKFRDAPREDNTVGRHHPPSSARVDDFMQYFYQRYQFKNLGASRRIISIAISHHRFNYIHPFPDGNGRVSRLMSHAMGLVAGIGAHGLWSISRGLARGLSEPGEYKRMMDRADSPRQGDLDGRGNLSEAALREFVTWFLQVAHDQIRFMSDLFELDRLLERLARYVGQQPGIDACAIRIIKRVLLEGAMPRGEAASVTGLKERAARNVLHSLLNDGILTSDSPKAPVFLKFSSKSADLLFPRLYIEQG